MSNQVDILKPVQTHVTDVRHLVRHLFTCTMVCIADFILHVAVLSPDKKAALN